MGERAYNLAIEASGRHGAIALGRGNELLAARRLTAPSGRRHDVGLAPGIDAICREFGVEPAQVGEVYVSLGPGSFTGLRVGVTTAKMLAFALGAKVVGVSTLEVLAEAAREAVGPAGRVAVGLNLKRGTLYSAVYRFDGERRVTELDPALRTVDQLLAEAGRPVAVAADKLPEFGTDAGVTRLPAEFGVGRAEVVWRIGREMAGRGEFADPATLAPLYAREPEAVTLWDEREKRAQPA